MKKVRAVLVSVALVGLYLFGFAGSASANAGSTAEPAAMAAKDPKPAPLTLPHINGVYPGYFQFVNKYSGMCADVQTENGLYVQQRPCSGVRVQAWQPYHDADGYYELFNLTYGPCLTGYGGWIGNGVPVVVQTCGANTYQQWQVVQVLTFPVNYYAFIDRNSNKCLTVPGPSTRDGVRLVEWDCQYSDNQLFTFN
jgi:hypothetical protein